MSELINMVHAAISFGAPNAPVAREILAEVAELENENQRLRDRNTVLERRCRDDGDRAQDYFERMKAANHKLDEIRRVIDRYVPDGGAADFWISEIREVLNRD